MTLLYSVRVRRGQNTEEISGSFALQPGVNRLHLELPEGVIERVTASLARRTDAREKIFMNGFQSWTYCPEYGRNDKIPGLERLPRFLVRRLGLDRYGDYYFTEYPHAPGMTHGESWCYFRRGERFELLRRAQRGAAPDARLRGPALARRPLPCLRPLLGRGR